MWNDHYADGSWYSSVLWDPISAIGAVAAIGSGIVGAAGAGAQGSAAMAAAEAQQQELHYQALQATQQSATDLATAQRTSLDDKLKANLAVSSARAGYAFGGVDAGAGSALTTQENLASRGEYISAMDLWSGQNQQTGDLNQAQADEYGGQLAIYSGQQQQAAYEVAGLGSIVGGFGKAISGFGKMS